MNNEDQELFEEFLAFKAFRENSDKKVKKKKKSKYTKRADGRYCTYVFIGLDNKTGKRIKKMVYGNTISELEDKVAQLKIEKQRGTDFSKQNITLGTYRKVWYEKKKLSLDSINSTHTIKMYDSLFKNYFGQLDPIKLKDVETADIQNIIYENQSKPRTCQKIRMVYNEIFKAAVAERILYYNPVDAVVIPQYTPSERRPLTDDEDYLTEVTAFSDREKAYLSMLKYAGLRKEEALALVKDDFDFDNNQVTINKAVIFVNNKPILKNTKNGTSRIVPLLPNITMFMKYYISNLTTDKLFVNVRNNEYMSEQGYRRMWETIIRKLNKKATELSKKVGDDLSAHIFRHNYACMLMHAGVDMKERQYLLGHKTISVTMDIYTHIEQNKMKAPERMQNYINEKASLN